jgi:hypothetical protein
LACEAIGRLRLAVDYHGQLHLLAILLSIGWRCGVASVSRKRIDDERGANEEWGGEIKGEERAKEAVMVEEKPPMHKRVMEEVSVNEKRPVRCETVPARASRVDDSREGKDQCHQANDKSGHPSPLWQVDTSLQPPWR